MTPEEKWAELQSFYSISRELKKKIKTRPNDTNINILYDQMIKFKASVARLIYHKPELEKHIHYNYEKKYGH
jgi:hypothetical protein